MANEPTWHDRAVEQLSRIFVDDPGAKAFILRGSLARDALMDDWSDLDAAVILADSDLDRYTLSADWLASFRKVIGMERHEIGPGRILRVFLEGFQRFDLMFIAESSLSEKSFWDDHPIREPCSVLWSRLPGLEMKMASNLHTIEYREPPRGEIERTVDEFWLKAAQAIVKVVRNDLLIALHLALDLAREGLVLQMIRRDRALGTTIHRTGGWGNEIVSRFRYDAQNASGEEILELIRSSCDVFDELALDLLTEYDRRAPFLSPHIESAEQLCEARRKTR